MIRKKQPQTAALTATAPIRVRFSEVDSMQVVWHGEYVRYFEDGREAFGRKYPGIGYLDIYGAGYTAPIVQMEIDYLHPLRLEEEATIEIGYLDSEAAKLCFCYEVRRADGELAARGRTTQVFVNAAGEMELNLPEFVKRWKENNLTK